MIIKLKGLITENKEVLNEVHLRDLYHATDYSQLRSILNDGKIKMTFAGGTDGDMEMQRGKQFYLSTMRQKVGNYALHGNNISYPVIIHLNGQSLTASGYKVFHADYWGSIMTREKSEQEERIVSDKSSISPLEKFIIDIHVYIKEKTENPNIVSNILKINEFAKKYEFPVWFYPFNEKSAFIQHRTERATRDVKQLGINKPNWSKDDLDYLKNRKKWNDPNKKTYLDSFLKIYKNEPLDPNNWMDEHVRKLLLYYHQDAMSSLKADIHNFKSKHPPIFDEIVSIMKKEGYKTFDEFVKAMIKRVSSKR